MLPHHRVAARTRARALAIVAVVALAAGARSELTFAEPDVSLTR